MEMSAVGRMRLRAGFSTDHAIIEYPGGEGIHKDHQGRVLGVCGRMGVMVLN